MLFPLLLCVCQTAIPAAQTVVRDEWNANDRSLSGTVVRPDGTPVPNAMLELRTRTPRASTLRARAASGPDGRFTLNVEPIDDHHFFLDSFLELEAEGLSRSHVERVYLPAPSYDLGPLVLHPPVELRGRVTSADGRPVANAAIHAALGPVDQPYGDHALRSPITLTDAAGEYACRVLPPGRITLGASAVGWADRMLAPGELRGDAVNRVDFVLAPERIARIGVTGRDGAPSSGARAEPLGKVSWEGPWAMQSRVLAFWRGAETADEAGWITVRGLEQDFAGDLLVTAPGYRAELVNVGGERALARLERVTPIEVVAECAGGGPAPELYEVVVRDGTRAPSWCGNCDESRLAKLWADSPAVERLAPDRWRIAWNGPGCYVDGGMPSAVSATTNDGTRATVELRRAPLGEPIECKLAFPPPARLAGAVRDPAGNPVSLRLGVQLSFEDRSDKLAVQSGSDGRFEFERIGGGSRWLLALDEHWEVDDATDRIELVAGRAHDGVEVLVHPRPDGRTGVVRGTMRIGGRAPGEPILLALDEVPNQHLPRAYPRGFAWTDAEGRFTIGSFWPRGYHILPKHHAAPGGWRDFAAEFPAHDWRWPWKVSVPASGSTTAEIDLPLESEWDAVARPEADADD